MRCGLGSACAPASGCVYKCAVCVQIKDQIQGVNGAVLPWEGERLTERVKGQLRLFQDALLQLLHHDPLQRPSMAQFCRTCSRMLGGESQ